MMYVLYLAVNDKIRSKGYGTLMLKHLNEMSGNKEITLNIESLDENADNYKQRVKRLSENNVSDYLQTTNVDFKSIKP